MADKSHPYCIIKELEQRPEKTEGGNGSNTGDNSNLLGVMTAMTGAALGLFALVAMRRREEDK